MSGFDNQCYGKVITKEKHEQIVAKQISYQDKKTIKNIVKEERNNHESSL